MATTINSTALDFNAIKTNLKTFFKSKSEFADYDFEASGLSNILDVLAYNTHYNGLVANFAINETFLDTAQLRSSIVSHAEALGYEPRSKTSSSATVTLTLTVSDPGRPSTITLPVGTRFKTVVDGVTYSYQTREAFTAVDDSGTYQFKTSAGSTTLTIHEGTENTKTFFVGESTERQIYVIPDETMDTNTIIVKVFTSTTGTEFVSYTNLKNAVTITSTSKHFEIKEVPNGFYELAFGDGNTTGDSPSAGNRIEVNYLSTKGALANNASSFEANNQVQVGGAGYTLGVVTLTNSSGGSEKEELESIRNNARRAFSSQQRLVTANDYEALILANYGSNITDVSAWGGEQNVPVKYGCVYVALKFTDGLSDTQKTSIKDQITTNLVEPLSIVTTDVIYVDPEDVFLELEVFYNFDPDLTSLTSNAISNRISTQINTHVTNNLKKFDKVFRRSLLTAEIDDLDTAILNSRMNIFLQKRITPSTTASSSYELAYPMAIAPADDVNHTVKSSQFAFQNRNCVIKNKLTSTTLQIVDFSSNEILVDNIGSYTPLSGKLNIVGFLPTTVQNSGVLKVSVKPANESTIRPLRNYIIDNDPALQVINTIVDNQNTEVTLTT